MPDDYYVSQYSGEEIDERLTAAHNAVRYDAAQSLTDAQKRQARRNIAAAPDGFGLGGDSKLLTSDDDVNTISASGWYGWMSDNVPINAIIVSNVTIMRVDAYNSAVNVQTLYGVTDSVDSIAQPIVVQRMIYGSKIGAWEYVNPPLNLGVEYRTTERYMGKPVYVKVVDFGTLPNATSKTVSIGVNNFDQFVDFRVSMRNKYMFGIYEPGISEMYVGEAGNIIIVTKNNMTDYSAYVIVKYTKTTD